MSKVNVSNYPDLKKDLVNGGVVNANVGSFESYKQQRAHALKQLSEKDVMRGEINTMKTELSDIKDMLKLLLDKQ